MNKKGFTLVELLAVIVILGLLALVAAPAITGILKSSKDKLSDTQKRNIELSAKNWATDNTESLPKTNGGSIKVKLSTLQAGGYADLEIKDPKSGNPIDACVEIKRVENRLEYKYTIECGGAI